MTENQKAPCLRDIVQFELNGGKPLFRRHHLNRDVVIGLVGERGDGKSLAGTAIAIIDYMLEGDPCWSNMMIGAEFDISDSLANKYGFDIGGKVQFNSQPLIKNKLLHFDSEYHDGVFFVDEINVWLADARRSMSNQNLWTDDVGQQLRKIKSALIYTCIHEMFVDQRIRDMTDIFIQTKDLALSPAGLAKKAPPGQEFMWTVYPMSRKLTGTSYAETHRALPNVFFHGEKLWGIFDTYQRQDRTRLEKQPIVPVTVTMAEDPMVVKSKKDFGWLDNIGKAMWDDGREAISADEVMTLPQVVASGLKRNTISKLLKERCQIGSDRQRLDKPYPEPVYIMFETNMETKNKQRLLVPV